MIIPRIPFCDLFLGFRIEKDYLLRVEEGAGEMPEGVLGIFIKGKFERPPAYFSASHCLKGSTTNKTKQSKSSEGAVTPASCTLAKITLTFALEEKNHSQPG